MRNNNYAVLDSCILIIEDDVVSRDVLKEILRCQGFSNIETADNGRSGLESIKLLRPDLVILDVMMPEMDGEECCKRIRNHPDPQIANVPILFQTALDGTANKARLFAAGATDYLSKPADPHEVAVRAMAHLEREAIARKLRDSHARMQQELDTARSTQEVLIPNAADIAQAERDYALQICDHFLPCTELGGDLWGFKSLSSHQLAIYMVDFSGHGVNAALNIFRLHALMHAARDTAHIPGAYLSHLNAILSPLLPTGQFATMFYGIIDTRNHTLAYASAGALPALFFKRAATTYHLLDNTGPLLGIDAASTFESRNLAFAQGDGILLFSDALIETQDHTSDLPDYHRWAQPFQQIIQTPQRNSRDAFDDLLNQFSTHYLPHQVDDLTLTSYFRR